LSTNNAISCHRPYLHYAQRFTAAVDFTDLHRALAVLRACNAFDDSPDARLRLPG
jgi:hypothetical protein